MRDNQHTLAAVWVVVTGISAWLTWRAWEVAKRDAWEIERRDINGYTRIAANAAVRRERLRCFGQLVGHWVGVPFVFLPPEPKWVPISPWRAVAPWGLIITHGVVLANTLLDFYDRRKALSHVIDLPPRRTLWRKLAILWEDN